MRSREIVVRLLCAGAVAALTIPSIALAQGKPAADTTKARPKTAGDTLPEGPTAVVLAPSEAGRVTVGAEIGGRTFSDPLTAQQLGKFDEYRDRRSGLFVEDLVVGYTAPDSFRTYRLTASNLGRLDQTLGFRAKQPGLFDFRLRWDRMPHTFSTTARSYLSEVSPGVFALPSPRPDTAAFNRAPFLAPVRAQWDPVRLALGVTPSSAWDFNAEYTRIGKNGERPLGQAFGGPGATSSEILEPIDQTMHDVKVSQSYSQERLQLVASYDLSVFRNAIKSVTSDNPQLLADTPTGGSARGRTALAPNNLAHTAVVTGGLNLPRGTRVTGNASMSWWKQDDEFVPMTINSAIVDPRLAQLPTSLGGSARIKNLAGSVTTRPLSRLTLSARYRSFSYRDEARTSVVPILIVNDRSISPADTARRDPFARRNADITGSWQLLDPLALSAGLTWEQIERDTSERQVLRTSERGPRVSLDFTGIEWLDVRASYGKTWRRGTDYVQGAEEAGFRRYDEADRDRERTSLMASVTPIEPVTLSGTWQVGHDNYGNSPFGVQSDRNTAVGGEISFALTNWLTGGFGVMRETFDNDLRMRYRTGTQLDNPTYVWIGNNRDVSTTTTADLAAIVIPGRLEAGGTYEISRSRYVMAGFNPTTPTGGTAAQNAAAIAVDLPEVRQMMQPIGTYLRYRPRPDWAVTLRYRGELYSQTDYKTATLVPATSTSAATMHVFLSDTFQNYDARYVTISISYRPQALRIGRTTL